MFHHTLRVGSEPIGEHFVQVCTTTPCMLNGAYDILKACQAELGGIKPGETTKDGKFTLIEVECQGACSNAPMLVVGDDFYVRLRKCCGERRLTSTQEDLTEETTKKILAAFAKGGQKPKPGPQSGRQTSENSAGLTALTSKVTLSSSPRLYVQTRLTHYTAVRPWRVLHTRLCVMRNMSDFSYSL
jgi:NADH dehydrogenase (ubiquinone) flavoprotein 2